MTPGQPGRQHLPGAGDPWSAPAAWPSWPAPAPLRSTAGLWVLAAVLLVLGSGLGVLGAVLLSVQHWMDEHAVPVTARVVSVDPTFDEVDVAFEVDGTPHRAVFTWYGLHPRVGETVAVEYDPEDPVVARMPDGTQDRDVGIAFGAGGAVLLLAGTGCATVAVRRGRR